MKTGKISFLFIFLFLLSSCSIVSFERLYIECNIPEEISLFNKSEIQLRFSISPDKQSFEDNLNFFVDGKTTETSIRWADSKNCYLMPADSWKKGSVYKLTIDSSIKMTDGRFYTVSLYRSFFYGENNPFEMVSCSIPEGAFIHDTDELTFSFNKALDELSFTKAFSISPSVSNTISFSSDKKTVTVHPNEHWKTNTIYKWKIENLRSHDDFPLKKTYEGLFKSPEDTVLPFVEAIYPVTINSNLDLWHTELNAESDLRVSDSLGIVFSEPVSKASLEKAISFSPSISGYITQADAEGKKYIWCIEENWKNETLYQLCISTALEDMNYMTPLEDYSFFFKPVNNYFLIESVQIGDKIVTDNFDAGYDITAPSNDILEIRITFNRGIADDYKNVIYNAFSLQSFFPTTAMSPSLIASTWSGASENILILKYSGYTVSSQGVKDYYQLKTNGLCSEKLDGSGNMLKEELCVYFSIL